MPKPNSLKWMRRFLAAAGVAALLSALSFSQPVAAAPSTPKFAPPKAGILFTAGSSKLSAAGSHNLNVSAGSFETAKAISITGYVRGTKQSAGALAKSAARAQAVAANLIAHGITATLNISGLGAASVYKKTKFADRVDIAATDVGSLIWSEEFNSPKPQTFDHKIWTALLDHGYDQLGFWNYGTGEVESNTEAAAVEDGTGNLTITASNATGDWTSARLWTQGKLNFQYGELKIRAKMPVGSFNWPAIWSLGSNYSAPNGLFGDTSWPASGEADIAEGLGGNSVVQGTIHGLDPNTGGPWFGGGGLTAVAPVNNFSSAFHVYGVRWKPNEFDFTVDGQVYSKNVYDGTNVTQTFANGSSRLLYVGDNWPYNQAIFLILDNAIQSGVTAPANSSGTMSIDWIRYYKWSGLGSLK